MKTLTCQLGFEEPHARESVHNVYIQLIIVKMTAQHTYEGFKQYTYC